VAPLGIRINCIAPGVIETAGWKVYSPEAVATYPQTNPMMRVGSTWDVAEACAFLGGPSGRFITGEVLNVAGGGQLWGETWTTGKPDYSTSEARADCPACRRFFRAARRPAPAARAARQARGERR